MAGHSNGHPEMNVLIQGQASDASTNFSKQFAGKAGHMSKATPLIPRCTELADGVQKWNADDRQTAFAPCRFWVSCYRPVTASKTPTASCCCFCLSGVALAKTWAWP